VGEPALANTVELPRLKWGILEWDWAQKNVCGLILLPILQYSMTPVLHGVLMHEMSIAQSLLDIIKEEMQKHDARILRAVRLNVGQMTAVVPEALTFCFEVMTSGTELEGAQLFMNMVPLKGYCPDCGREFTIEDYTFICPTCGGTNIETIGGQDLSIVDIEVD
jgi:hydrogenase nickel incorporation protein HypA/HybF